MKNIILLIFMSVGALFLARALFIALKYKKIELYYGENVSPEWDKEPISFIFIFVVILTTLLIFTYLAFDLLMEVLLG